ncbi:MAG: hypothetical protein AABO58_09635 [Acidobacteriota bacterium]
MTPKKPRLLFVIGHLFQSGAERFTYEVLKGIDRERFDVELLTKRRITPRDYYYDRIRALGIPIHTRLPLWLGRVQRRARPLFLLFRRPIEALYRRHARLALGDLLDHFDVINAVQIENYYLLQPLLRDNRRVVVYLMSHRFQYAFNPYADCDPGRTYRFVQFDPSLREEYADAPCRGAETILFPLAIDLSGTADLSKSARIEETYRIGVFIRLAPDRPISGIFRAFALLRQQVDAELWLYGRGNPALYEKELRELGVRENVVFRGHTANIEKTLREDGLSVVWMTSFGPMIAYASIEVAGYAFPMLFWNQHGRMPPDEIRARTGGAIESFYDPENLAEATVRALRQPEQLRALGRRLRAHVLERNEISGSIRGLEEALQRIAAGEPETPLM